MTENVVPGPAWIDKFDGVARRWRGNSLEAWKPGKGWEKAPTYPSLSVLEQDERDTERMCATLAEVAEELEREGKLPPRKEPR
jgi:hypothetical protein